MAVIALTGVLGVPAAWAGSGGGKTTTTPRVNAGDDPCVLLTAAEVEAAVGVVDPDGAGAAGGGVVNQCIYGEPLGFHFRISNAITGDGGKDAKDECKRAKAGNPGYADYAPVKGVGKYACAYTLRVVGKSAPTLVVVALYRGSTGVGRELHLAVSGTAEQLAPIEARIDPGLMTLARKAAGAVKRETG